MTTFYISSISGSDANSGRDAAHAWASLSKVSKGLSPGDTVLLERGSDFDQTLALSKSNGTADRPITISAYGTGDAPILSSSNGNGIQSLYCSYFVVENLTIQQTANAGLYGTAANHWIVRNVTFDNTGGANNVGSVSWWNSTGFVFENNTVLNAHGDGMYMSNVNGVTVTNSVFNGVTGATADSIQIQGNDTVLAGNTMIIQDTSNTTKGNVVVLGDNMSIHDNYLQGGGYGLGLSGNNITIENNVMKDHDKYSWSSNIQISDQKTGDAMSNITIQGNSLYDANRNITFDGKNSSAANMTVTNLNISGNDFHEWDRASLLFNGVNVVGGVFKNNVSDQADPAVVNVSSNLSGLVSEDNGYQAPLIVMADSEIPGLGLNFVLPAPILKTISITASASLFEGAPILVLSLNGHEVGEQAVTALRANGEKQTVSFQIESFSEGDKFSIQFVNDKVGKTGDRNLYIHSVSMDGMALNLKSADLTSKIFNQKDGSGLFFSSNASATFTSDDVPHSVLTKVAAADSHVPSIGSILDSGHGDIVFGSTSHDGAGGSSGSAYAASFQTIASSDDHAHANMGMVF